MPDYVAPEMRVNAFNCPHCGAYAHQEWRYTILGTEGGSYVVYDDFVFSQCAKCKKCTIWYNNKMVYPNKSTVPLPADDMPLVIKDIYTEARSIFEMSPKASAALLRLGIQKLCVFLGENGKNINDDIANLVSKGLPIKVQKALDIVRVVGNNAVHPGEINIDDDPSIAFSLFQLVNMIVDTMITQPNEINKMFDSLPEGAKMAIEKRDAKITK